MMKRRRTSRLSFQWRQTVNGWLFSSPFLVGFLMFFLLPMLQSIRFAFSSMKIEEHGLVLRYVGLKNFRDALFSDPRYIRTIVESLQNLLIQVPIILVFSMFIALLLNQRFRGRGVFRGVFFLPVIVMSGIILQILQADYLSTSILSGGLAIGGYGAFTAYDALYALGFPRMLLEGMIPIIRNIFNLIWSSGVQILMFLAGLQTVPDSMYECARIEGATDWEMFWKITFPLVSPMILMNVIYSIVDYFTTSTNPVIQLINEQSANLRFEYAAGLSWMYLIVVLILLGVVYLLMNRRMTYIVE